MVLNKTVVWKQDAYKGERIFLFGTGASLTWQNPVLIDRILADEWTCGVNGLHLWNGMTHAPTFYTLIDHPAFPMWREAIEALDTYRVAGLRADWPAETPQWQRVLQRRDLPITEGHWSGGDEYGNFEWCAGRSNVMWSLAAQMVYWLGFKEVYLLGVDGEVPRGVDGPRIHCYEIRDFCLGHISESRSNFSHRTTQSVRLAVSVAMAKYEEAGRKLVNCNVDSFVGGLPKMRLEDVI